MFENGVKETDSQARNVRKAGLLLTLAGYIFFAEPEDRMDAMLASHKDLQRMLDNYEKLGEMAATIALYRLPRIVNRFGQWGLLMHETGVYADKMGELMELAHEPDGEDATPLRSWGERRFSAYWR